MFLNLASEPVFRQPFVSDRDAYACADALVHKMGEDAVITAAARADAYGAKGDGSMEGYWRRVESAVQILLLRDVVGELH